MSYEQLKARFSVLGCADYRAGSAYELVAPTAPAVVGTPQMKLGQGLFGKSASYLHYGDVLDITDTTQPFTLVCQYAIALGTVPAAANRFLDKYTAAPGWYFGMSATSAGRLYVATAGGVLDCSPTGLGLPSAQRVHTLIASYNGGLLAAGVQFYYDGVPYGATAATDTLTAASAANAVNFAVISPSGTTTPLIIPFWAFLGQATTPADQAYIYEMLASERPARSRPARYILVTPPKPNVSADSALVVDLPAEVVSRQDAKGNAVTRGTSGRLDQLRNNGMPCPAIARLFQTASQAAGPSVAMPASWGSAGGSVASWVSEEGASNGYFVQAGLQNNLALVLLTQGGGNTLQAQLLEGANYYRNSVVTLPAGMVAHFATGSDVAGTRKVWVNGVPLPITIFTAYITPPASSQLSVGRRSTAGAAVAQMTYGQTRAWNRLLTDAEVRAEYLQGAKSTVLNARLKRDDSSPVTPTTISGAQQMIPGTPWRVGSGSWQTIEDAPVGTRLGQRRIKCVTAGTLSTVNNAAYGAYLIALKRVAATGTWCNFIADRVGASTDPLGYAVNLSSTGVLSLVRTTGGGSVSLFATAAGYTAANTLYYLWVTRRYDGQFSVWILGGAYTSWTFVAVTGGSNPVTDTTYTSGKYVLVQAGIADEVGDVYALFGEMTAAEAMAADVLQTAA